MRMPAAPGESGRQTRWMSWGTGQGAADAPVASSAGADRAISSANSGLPLVTMQPDHDGRDRARLRSLPEDPPERADGQRPDGDADKVGEGAIGLDGVVRCPGSQPERPKDADPLVGQPPEDERQDPSGRAVEPLHVVDRDDDRLT